MGTDMWRSWVTTEYLLSALKVWSVVVPVVPEYDLGEIRIQQTLQTLVATAFLKGTFLMVPITATKLRFPELSYIAALEKKNEQIKHIEDQSANYSAFFFSNNFISCLCCFKTLYSDATKEKRALVCEVQQLMAAI